MPSTIEIFCCYAREDQPLLEHLKKHLMLLQRQGLVSIWSDTSINAGEEWEKAIHAHLDTAHIILLLISPDFMASDYCYSTEMQRAMQRHTQGDVRVIPILLRHTYCKGAPFADLQMLPKDAKPVVSWLDKDEPLYTIADQISLLVKELQIQHALQEAEQLYLDERYEGALVLYDQVLVQEPQNVYACAGKAKTLLELQRYKESLEALELAEQIDPSIAGVTFYLLKASDLYQLKRYKEGLLAYDKALQICTSEHEGLQIYFSNLSPSYSSASATDLQLEICCRKADIFLQLKQYREALEAYEQAIRFEPDMSVLYLLKGDLLFRLRAFDSALKMYDEAIRLEPREVSYYEQKGKLLLEWQHYEEAFAVFEVLTLSITPQPRYYEQKGQALLKLERYEEALTTYEQALQTAKEGPQQLVIPVRSYDASQAEKEITPYLHSGKSQALLGLERYEDALAEALAAFATVIEFCTPNNIDPQFYHNQAIAYERLAQRAYEMEQQSRLLWLQKQDEEPFFIDLLKTQAVQQQPQQAGWGGWLEEVAPMQTQLQSSAWDGQPQPQTACESLLNIEKFTLLRTLEGHKDRIGLYGIAISPDGQTLVSGSLDQTIKVWELATGRELRTLRGHTELVPSVAVNPDGQTIISGGNDGMIKAWELSTGRELRTVSEYVGSYVRVNVTPDGQKIVSGSDNGTIKVWELASGNELRNLEGHKSNVLSIAISPDGQKIVCGCADGIIEIWGVQ